MGTPFFHMRQLIERHQVRVYSSNYTLYGDMSRRVHDILAALAPASEEYSIDESFLRLDGIDDLAGHARQIAAHESPRTTKLYDRTSDEITLDEKRAAYS